MDEIKSSTMFFREAAITHLIDVNKQASESLRTREQVEALVNAILYVGDQLAALNKTVSSIQNHLSHR